MKTGIGHFDGATFPGNPGIKGLGFFIRFEEDCAERAICTETHGTNNEAEYEALIELLKLGKELGIQQLQVYGDSQLVIKQVNGDWRVKKPELKPLCKKAQQLANDFELCTIDWVSRDNNQLADELSKAALAALRKNARKDLEGSKSAENTNDGAICDFGTHSGKPYTRLPVAYLRWMVSENHNKAAYAKAELERRGTTEEAPHAVSISIHAIDRASTRLYKIWKAETSRKIGIVSWLNKRAEEAVETTSDFQQKITKDGIVFVFEDSLPPTLVTVYCA